MKRTFCTILLITSFIPLIAQGQITSTQSIQNKSGININSQLLGLIQSLLEQISVLQKRIDDIHKEQIKMNEEAEKFKSDINTSIKPLVTPISTINLDINVNKKELLNNKEDYATIVIKTKTTDGNIATGRSLKISTFINGNKVSEAMKTSDENGTIVFFTNTISKTEKVSSCGSTSQMKVDIIDETGNILSNIYFLIMPSDQPTPFYPNACA